MRTRNQSKTGKQPFSSSESLADVSREAVGKLLQRAEPGRNKKRKQLHTCLTPPTPEKGAPSDKKDNVGSAECNSGNVVPVEPEAEAEREEDMDEPGWEDGSVPISDAKVAYVNDEVREITVEFNEPPDSAKRKPVRRASAEDKELAELVHKVHLLCLIARGRLIDSACDDPLIQASLLSILPSHLLKISKVSNLSAKALAPLVNWFHENFNIRSSSDGGDSFPSALAHALESRGGTPEEVAALSVALFRALNLTTRFVAILNVASLKPEAEKSEASGRTASRASHGIFGSSTPMVHRQSHVLTSAKMFPGNSTDNISEASQMGQCKMKISSLSTKDNRLSNSLCASKMSGMLDTLASEKDNNALEACHSTDASKRKGDIEFEMHLQMALSATAIENRESGMISDEINACSSSSNLPSLKNKKVIRSEGSSISSQGISTAIGSKKVGPPLYWAEIYCNGENLTGRWVHTDAVNAIIDAEQNVEAAAAACKTSLRYVVAFAGHGAKDVTRRYCMKWYKISSLRINSDWWDRVLAPLKELESRSTRGQDINLSGKGKTIVAEPSVVNSFPATRDSLEDLELETRALTEPLPTNQQAYKTHQLYALERWLSKYQILHPKNPVLGFCSGHPVYPRACVQTLKTKSRWLREGLQVKSDECPAKELKRPVKFGKIVADEADYDSHEDGGGAIALYGKWQTETLSLPHAINGLVPKNERGQVDAWSEKCLPPGTVHLRLPRVHVVAKRLGIDYAPAMVGFEFRNGRSCPVYNGIVVCAEFEDAVLEAYAEEEERREAEEKKRNERQALSRWYQLLSSILTRQRLNNCYGNESSEPSAKSLKPEIYANVGGSGTGQKAVVSGVENLHDSKQTYAPPTEVSEGHEHVYLAEDQIFDEDTLVFTKRCRCGFSIQVEEF